MEPPPAIFTGPGSGELLEAHLLSLEIEAIYASAKYSLKYFQFPTKIKIAFDLKVRV